MQPCARAQGLVGVHSALALWPIKKLISLCSAQHAVSGVRMETCAGCGHTNTFGKVEIRYEVYNMRGLNLK